MERNASISRLSYECLEQLTDEQYSTYMKAAMLDHAGKHAERSRDIRKSVDYKFDAGRLYESLGLLIEDKKARKEFYLLAAFCYDTAGKNSGRLNENQLKYRARIKAAELYDQIDERFQASYSYLWASEALYLQGDKGQAESIFEKAKDRYYDVSDCSPKELMLLENKLKKFADSFGFDFE